MSFTLSMTDQDAHGDFLRVFTSDPGECGACHTMTTQFISRDGRSSCTACDAAQQTPELLTQQQVALRLGLGRKTLQRLRRSGELPCVRLGYRSLRYEPRVVEHYITQHTSEVQP